MADLTARLAELAVAFGANVQRGQVVAVTADLGHAPLARAVAEAAYRAGARFVDVGWFDPHVKHARLRHAAADTLDWVPPWYGARVEALGEVEAAIIAVTGPTERDLFADVDPERLGKDRLPSLKESLQVINDRLVNWTVVPGPSAVWAELVHPELPPDEALERLRHELAHVCRLDEDDPVAAWHERMDVLVAAAARLSERRFDALRFRGPGTDLTVGLLPSSRWAAARFSRRDGLVHHPNLPTEEVFTSPDPVRAEGAVAATKPLVFPDGSVVRGLRVRFEGGRAVEIEADEGSANITARVDADEGGRRLGEVALVDREGRIGPLGTVFHDTLLDENAASHLALGSGFPFAVDETDVPRVNESAIHIDFMVGGSDVDVTGLTADGTEVPVLLGGAWQV